MDVKTFADRAEISLSLAYQLIAEGRVPHRRFGQKGKRGCIRITEEDFRAFMEEMKSSRALAGRDAAFLLHPAAEESSLALLKGGRESAGIRS